MARDRVQYVCGECGAQYPKWSGYCSECSAWNSLAEVAIRSKQSRQVGYAGENQTQAIGVLDEEIQTRLPSGFNELDRVLGDGVVQGSVILIGGDPGIGKSTLLLQCLAHLAKRVNTLYVTGEESLQQVSLRAQRAQLIPSGGIKNLKLFADTLVENILTQAQIERPQVMVIDSIQTLYTDNLSSAPGSVSQVRECAAQLVRFAKQTNTAVFLVGHMTKEGSLAGPRVLEHMVDTVLYFEGETSRFRVIRAIKNRFGAVNELGVFAMTEKGLKEVKNPSAIFLSRHDTAVPGSSVLVTREGSRPFLVEVQALVDQSQLANPRRLSLGLDQNRLGMLLAVLHRHGNIATAGLDVFVNIVGGVRVSETGADLAALLAVLSSLRNKPLSNNLVVFGEVGLSGEIRPVPGGQERLREAAKHGFTQAIVPKDNEPKITIKGLKVNAVQRLSEAIDLVS